MQRTVRHTSEGTDPVGTLEPLLSGLSERGDRPALIQIIGDRQRLTSYAELANDVDAFAAGIAERALERGSAVALFAHSGPDWITACLGLIRAGAVPVPLDTQLDEEALRHILDDCRAELVLADTERLEVLRRVAYRGAVVLLDSGDDAERSRQKWRADRPRRFDSPKEEECAVLFYTSGTTGPPKGVPLKHRHLAYQLEAVSRAGLVQPDERVLQPLPLHHVYPLVVGTFAPLALGLPIVLPEAMTGPQVVAAIREGQPTFVIGVPRLYRALLEGIERRLAAQGGLGAAYLRTAARLSTALRRHLRLRVGKLLLRPLHARLSPQLRVLASGGSPLDPELAWRLEGFGWRIGIGYGLTETSPLLTLNPPGGHRLDSVGRTVPGTELRIEHAPTGAYPNAGASPEGEILARGPGVFDGYLGHEERSIDDGFIEDGWLKTGDLGRLDDGYLFVTGRKSTMIVTGAGKNVQPEALEAHYAEHALIGEIGILADDDRLAAVIVPDFDVIRGHGITIRNAMQTALSESAAGLATYKTVTDHVVSRTPLPRTRMGKIQRHRLRELYRELKRGASQGRAAAAPMKPDDMPAADRQRLENENAQAVWALFCRRYANRELAPDTDLQIDLGIDSLGWLDLSTEVSQQLGITLDEAQIVRIRTIRDLLRVAADAGDTGQATAGTPLDNPGAVLTARQRELLEPLATSIALLARTLYGLNRVLAKTAFRLRVSGVEQMPSTGPLLITPNHTSFLDPFAIAAALPVSLLEHTFWAGWPGYVHRNRLFRYVSRAARVLPVDPDRAASTSLAFAASVLKAHHNLVWFPEGRRSSSGRMLPLRPGAGLLMEHFPDTVLVPAYVDGAYEAWPTHRRVPRLRQISVTFGNAVSADQLAGQGRGDQRHERITEGLASALKALEKQAS